MRLSPVGKRLPPVWLPCCWSSTPIRRPSLLCSKCFSRVVFLSQARHKIMQWCLSDPATFDPGILCNEVTRKSSEKKKDSKDSNSWEQKRQQKTSQRICHWQTGLSGKQETTNKQTNKQTHSYRGYKSDDPIGNITFHLHLCEPITGRRASQLPRILPAASLVSWVSWPATPAHFQDQSWKSAASRHAENTIWFLRVAQALLVAGGDGVQVIEHNKVLTVLKVPKFKLLKWQKLLESLKLLKLLLLLLSLQYVFLCWPQFLVDRDVFVCSLTSSGVYSSSWYLSTRISWGWMTTVVLEWMPVFWCQKLQEIIQNPMPLFHSIAWSILNIKRINIEHGSTSNQLAQVTVHLYVLDHWRHCRFFFAECPFRRFLPLFNQRFPTTPRAFWSNSGAMSCGNELSEYIRVYQI